MTEGMLFDPSIYTTVFPDDNYTLGEIPDFQSLLPKAHAAGAPVFSLTDAEMGVTGPVLDQMKLRRETFNTLFDDLTQKVTTLMANA